MRTIPGQKFRLDKISKIAQHFLRILNHLEFIPSSRFYNLTISNKKKFVWFRVAKVGSRTIYSHLKKNGSSLDLEHAYNVLYAPRVYDDYFKFAFVRNPWDRVVSCWYDKVFKKNHFKFNDVELKRMRQFKYFIDYVSSLDIERCNSHLRLQCTLIDLNAIDYLGRFETFADDLCYVLDRIEIPTDKLLHKNKSYRKKNYREYYNSTRGEKISQIYQKDIDIFGYKFD